VLDRRGALGDPLRRAARAAQGGREPLRRLSRRAFAALALTAALAGCGAGAPVPAPQGPPAARHGERALLELTVIEEVRAALVSASNLYAAQRAAEARRHVRRARALYAAELRRGVRGRDDVLDREVVAAFAAIDADLRRRAPLAVLRERIGALSGQLLDAVEGQLVPASARADAGARAEVLSRTLGTLDRAYAYGLGPGSGRPERRFQLERAYGLLARSQSSARGLVSSLGPDKDPVLLALSTVRMRAFPVGILRPPGAAPPAELHGSVRRLQQALARRYRLE